MKQFCFDFSKQFRKWGHQSTPTVPCGSTADSSFNSNPRLTTTETGVTLLLRFPFGGTLFTITRAGDLGSGHGLWQILHLSDLDIIGDSYTLMTRGLSNNRRLNTSQTKPSFKCVPSILPSKHNNILFLISDNSIISSRQCMIPRVINRILADTTCYIHSSQQHGNSIVC